MVVGVLNHRVADAILVLACSVEEKGETSERRLEPLTCHLCGRGTEHSLLDSASGEHRLCRQGRV